MKLTKFWLSLELDFELNLNFKNIRQKFSSKGISTFEEK